MNARYWWCLTCGHRVHYISDRFAWRHDEPGADHAPRPVSYRPRVVA